MNNHVVFYMWNHVIEYSDQKHASNRKMSAEKMNATKEFSGCYTSICDMNCNTVSHSISLWLSMVMVEEGKKKTIEIE